MFNSAGNKGNLSSSGTVEPFEVLGKWMSRYVMWQLGFANNLFISKGGVLGPCEVEWDANGGCFMPTEDQLAPNLLCISDDDEDYSASDASFDSDSDDLDEFTEEDYALCGRIPAHEGRRPLRTRLDSMY